jgi:hypothetical protein
MFLLDLPGGLGNQLFAYFAGLHLKLQTNKEVKLQFATVSTSHVGSDYNLSSFRLQLDPIDFKCLTPLLLRIYYPEKSKTIRQIYRLGKSPIISFKPGEDTLQHVDSFFATRKNQFIPRRVRGYFADFQFYDELPDSCKHLELIKPSYPYKEQVSKMQESRIAGIHIRAGDYLFYKDSIGILDDNYYLHAINLISRLEPGIFFMVFTNDYSYAIDRISNWKLANFKVISVNDFSDPAESLSLLSQCNYIIASNSTFSFWAARISKIGTGIYVPDIWRKDQTITIHNIPESWNKIKSSWL